MCKSLHSDALPLKKHSRQRRENTSARKQPPRWNRPLQDLKFNINNRLSNWVEECAKVAEEQAGLRKNRSTVDNIFTFQAMVQIIYVKREVVFTVRFKKE